MTEQDTKDEVSQSDDQAELCERCRSVDWDDLLSRSGNAMYGTTLFDLGVILSVAMACPVCHFFHRLVGGEDESSQYNTVREGIRRGSLMLRTSRRGEIVFITLS